MIRVIVLATIVLLAMTSVTGSQNDVTVIRGRPSSLPLPLPPRPNEMDVEALKDKISQGKQTNLNQMKDMLSQKYKDLVSGGKTANQLIQKDTPSQDDNSNAIKDKLKEYQQQLIEFYNNKESEYLQGDNKDNTDNGDNNSIKGQNNEVSQGDGNVIRGKANKVAGNSNQVHGENQRVYGHGNVVMALPQEFKGKGFPHIDTSTGVTTESAQQGQQVQSIQQTQLVNKQVQEQQTSNQTCSNNITVAEDGNCTVNNQSRVEVVADSSLISSPQSLAPSGVNSFTSPIPTPKSSSQVIPSHNLQTNGQLYLTTGLMIIFFILSLSY